MISLPRLAVPMMAFALLRKGDCCDLFSQSSAMLYELTGGDFSFNVGMANRSLALPKLWRGLFIFLASLCVPMLAIARSGSY